MKNVKNIALRVSVRLYMLMLKLHELKRKALLGHPDLPHRRAVFAACTGRR